MIRVRSVCALRVMQGWVTLSRCRFVHLHNHQLHLLALSATTNATTSAAIHRAAWRLRGCCGAYCGDAAGLKLGWAGALGCSEVTLQKQAWNRPAVDYQEVCLPRGFRSDDEVLQRNESSHSVGHMLQARVLLVWKVVA